MFLRSNRRSKDGKQHIYWSLVETVRTPDGPRQRTLCYLGELNGSAQARWVKTVEVFNEQGEAQQLKLFPSQVEAPPGDPQVARVLLDKVRLERTRQFGPCWLGLELWKRLELDRFFAAALDQDAADVAWSRIAAAPCVRLLHAFQRHWIRLFQAVGARDADAMALHAQALLREAPNLGPEARAYLLMAAMGGTLASGRHEEALAHWDAHAPLLGPEAARPAFRLLRCHAARGASCVDAFRAHASG